MSTIVIEKQVAIATLNLLGLLKLGDLNHFQAKDLDNVITTVLSLVQKAEQEEKAAKKV